MNIVNVKREIPRERLEMINSFFKIYDEDIIPYQICEICLKPRRLIICEVCKNYYHLECIGMSLIPVKFYCFECKDFAKENQKLTTIYDGKKMSSTNLSVNNNLQAINNNLISKKQKREFETITQPVSKPSQNNDRIIKHRKKRINNFEDNYRNGNNKKRELLAFENQDIHYKRRKIKIGINHNIDMDDFYDRIENCINFDEVDFERKDMLKVFSGKDNPLTEEENDKYLHTARLFWNYRNLNIENELCADFFQDLNIFLMNNKLCAYNKKQILENKINSLKKFINNGITLNNSFDEIALKILHFCKYKTKVALLLLYKGVNPFLEEIEEGFRNDITFFQKEILALLSDDEN